MIKKKQEFTWFALLTYVHDKKFLVSTFLLFYTAYYNNTI